MLYLNYTCTPTPARRESYTYRQQKHTNCDTNPATKKHTNGSYTNNTWTQTETDTYSQSTTHTLTERDRERDTHIHTLTHTHTLTHNILR